ncbi:helix-turn-helix domain-containing protein [Pelagimonas varians]|uniref:DNA-binding transcriptional repressor PuuR n=1 Tax=Pelagimonas varians TaxID=696760 RepID=A0A238JNU4_9RHOB|nr:XRE family transcriptional regulator [Pelagimonas varians]PYG34802.1 XRE family transcriptional regulator [Pelagimonas varians]SMX32358.1 DNA-binding transcriptional repressor PuuR [Pelagimonas varians]
MKTRASSNQNENALDVAVGLAVKMYRSVLGLTLAELSERTGVSSAMISKIERGQMSASLATLEALADGTGVPLVNFFAETIGRTDVTFVPKGQGINVQRLGDGFGHTYKMIGRAKASNVGLESFLITLEQPLPERPLYQHPGAEFIQVVEGTMIYKCGEAEMEMTVGDSLSYDSSTPHGVARLLTEKVSFLSVACQTEVVRR